MKEEINIKQLVYKKKFHKRKIFAHTKVIKRYEYPSETFKKFNLEKKKRKTHHTSLGFFRFFFTNTKTMMFIVWNER